MTCVICNGKVSTYRSQIQPRVKTCSPGCAAALKAELHRRAARRYRARKKLEAENRV